MKTFEEPTATPSTTIAADRRDPSAYQTSRPLAIATAVGRMLLGFTFLWAFLDKTFGLGYSTASANAWIRNGSPTYGFLAHVSVGPFEDVFHSIAGNWAVNWLFMLGLLGIGVALFFGVALRAAAVAGVVMLVLMWAAEWPMARYNSAGELTGSTSPFVDYHLVYAITLVMIALVAGAGSTWGLADRWAAIPFVAKHPWLK